MSFPRRTIFISCNFHSKLFLFEANFLSVENGCCASHPRSGAIFIIHWVYEDYRNLALRRSLSPSASRSALHSPDARKPLYNFGDKKGKKKRKRRKVSTISGLGGGDCVRIAQRAVRSISRSRGLAGGPDQWPCTCRDGGWNSLILRPISASSHWLERSPGGWFCTFAN